jgi:prolyl 4-hydroxylase
MNAPSNEIGGHYMGQTVNPALQEWIFKESRSGRSFGHLLQAMLLSGWNEETAIEILGTALIGGVDVGRADLSFHLSSATGVPEPTLSDAPLQLDTGDHMVEVVISMRRPRVVVFRGVLSDAECEGLIESARQRIKRSQTVEYSTGGAHDHPGRTSQGMFFQRGENELVSRVEQRIARLLNWPVENGEPMQVLRYAQGNEYKPHYDYFDPDQAGTAAILQRGGQRVGSLVIYLNSPEQGGSTIFPDVGFEVMPHRGNAVFFSYERAHPSTQSRHGGSPVVAGEKWVATKWLRERATI